MPEIKLNGARFFFDVYGSKLSISKTVVKEKPTLLMLHGAHGLLDHTIYVEFWSKFADIAQVIFLDQRGCGRSDRGEADQWNLCQWGQDVYDFCLMLGIEKPIVVGVSMGGHVICEYATRYPDHPGSLIFCHTEARVDIKASAKKFEQLGDKESAAIYLETFLSSSTEMIQRYQQHFLHFYNNEIKRITQRPEVFEHFCRNEVNQFNYLDCLSRIACPTLFMVGEKSLGHWPECAKEMAAGIDSRWVTYHLFKAVGTPVYQTSPDEAYQAVRNFIEAYQ